MTAENYYGSVQVLSRESSVSSKDHVRQKKHNGLIDLWAVCFRAVLYRTGWKPPPFAAKRQGEFMWMSMCTQPCWWCWCLEVHPHTSPGVPIYPTSAGSQKASRLPHVFWWSFERQTWTFSTKTPQCIAFLYYPHYLASPVSCDESDSRTGFNEVNLRSASNILHDFDSHVGLMMTQNDLERSDKFPSTHNYPVKRYYQYRILTASQSFSNSQFDSSASTSFQSVSSSAFLLPRPARQNDASLKAPAITGSCPFKPTCFKLLRAHGKQCWCVNLI